MADPIARRVAERNELIERAEAYVAALAGRMPIVAAAVVGSVARGDFNVWSDIDVVIVAEGLPSAFLDRQALLLRGATPGIQPVGFAPDEFRKALTKRNRMAEEIFEAGVVLTGDAFFREVAAVRRGSERHGGW